MIIMRGDRTIMKKTQASRVTSLKAVFFSFLFRRSAVTVCIFTLISSSALLAGCSRELQPNGAVAQNNDALAAEKGRSLAGTANSTAENLTCHVDWLSALPTTQQVGLSGSSVSSQVGVNDSFGGIGTLFSLINNQVPQYPVNILDTRSGGGAAWQWSSLVTDWPGGAGTIIANQAAGNSIGYQWGESSSIWTAGASIGSYTWNTLFADSATASSGGLSPCNSGNDYSFDYGSPSITGNTVSTADGDAILWQNNYTFDSQVNQNWPAWSAINGFYFPRQIARQANLRVYLISGGVQTGPILPYDHFTFQGASCSISQAFPGISGSSCTFTQNYDYVVLVWNIFGQDIGIAIPNVPAGSGIGLEDSIYCSDSSNDACGSIFLLESVWRSNGTVSFPIGTQRSYSINYYVGNPQQLADLGYAVTANQVFSVSGSVYYENSSNQYCWYQDPSYLSALAGGQPILRLNAIPAGATSNGACQPSNQLFSVNGSVYFENGASHYCWVSDPSYLSGLFGGQSILNLDALPGGAVQDLPCGPINQAFTVGNAIYYANNVRQYCWISSVNNYLEYLNAGGVPTIPLDAFPVDYTDNGPC
jgi:hypothetical protein